MAKDNATEQYLACLRIEQYLLDEIDRLKTQLQLADELLNKWCEVCGRDTPKKGDRIVQCLPCYRRTDAEIAILRARIRELEEIIKRRGSDTTTS